MRTIFLLAVIGLLFVTSGARATADLRIARTAGDEVVSIVPGATVDLALRIENAGDVASAADITYHVYVDRLDVEVEYAFAMQPGACSSLLPIPGLEDSMRFTIPALAPQASIECTIHIERVAGSRSDVMVGIGLDDADPFTGDSLGLLVGQPAPSELHIQKQPSFVAGGRIQQYVRISYRNDGAVSLEEVSFGRCTDAVTASVEIDFPGACASSGPASLLCFMGSESFALPGPIAPGATSSCMVRMTEHFPRGLSYGGGMWAADLARNSGGGYTALLPSEGINLTIDDVVPSVDNRSQRVPALGLGAMLALTALVLVLARPARQ